MKIGIDGNEANQKNRVGVGQFAFNVLKNLESLDFKNEYIVYLKENPSLDFPKERLNWRYEIFGPGKLWTQIALPIKLFTQKNKLDVFYSPSHYAPRISPFPTVISLMDLWHHRHPEQFNKKDLYQLLKWEAYSVKNALKIVTISEFTKSEIIKFYNYPKEKIVVAYPGHDKFEILSSKSETHVTNVTVQANSKIQIIKNKHNIKGDYLLYLGTLQPKKNVTGLIEALSILISQYPNITLVVVGKKGWMFEEIFDKVKRLGLERNVVFTGFIDDKEKPYLIAGAKAFVLPSFYEGFGIPVAEAMDLGVLVACSKEGSLPEVGGEAVIYFDPYDITDMARQIKKVLDLNTKQRNEIISKGRKQAQKFSWENCAKTIFTAITNIK